MFQIPWLKETGNVVSILNLEIRVDEGPVQGIDTRTWGIGRPRRQCAISACDN